MGEDIEFVVPDRGDNARGDIGWIEPRLQPPGDFGNHQSGRAYGIERLRLAVPRRPVAPAVADGRADEARTEHADPDAMRLDLHRQSLRHRDHRELACRVGAEAETAIYPAHRRGV